MTIDDSDYHFMENSLNIQLKLVRDRIEQMQLVEKAIQDTTDAIRSPSCHRLESDAWPDSSDRHGKSMKNQYQNASNISSRINLHSLYSQNKQGWFPWVYESSVRFIRGWVSLNLDAVTVLCGHRIFPVSPVKFPSPFWPFIRNASWCQTCYRTQRQPFSFRGIWLCRNSSWRQKLWSGHCKPCAFYCEDIPAVCSEIQRVLTRTENWSAVPMEKTHAGSQQTGPGFWRPDRPLRRQTLWAFWQRNGADILAPYFSLYFLGSYRDSFSSPMQNRWFPISSPAMEIKNQYLWTNTKISGDLYRERQRMGSLLPRMPAFSLWKITKI